MSREVVIAAWAAGGECSRNPLYMRPSCKKSCRLCACGVDSSPWCPVWAFGLRNECTANPAWMGANCRFSCCNPRGLLYLGFESVRSQDFLSFFV